MFAAFQALLILSARQSLESRLIVNWLFRFEIPVSGNPVSQDLQQIIFVYGFAS
jgi:hypothetical protein